MILSDVPAPIGLLKDTQELVWGTSALDLRLHNEDLIQRMDVDSAVRDAFFANKHFTLSEQTRLVQAMERLLGVTGRGRLLDGVAHVASSEEVRFYVRRAELLTLYYEQRAPLEELFTDEHGPLVALDEDGRVVVALPLDYLNWSRSALEMAVAVHKAVARHAHGGTPEIWVEGTVSERARHEIDHLGWTFHELAFEHLAAGRSGSG